MAFFLTVRRSFVESVSVLGLRAEQNHDGFDVCGEAWGQIGDRTTFVLFSYRPDTSATCQVAAPQNPDQRLLAFDVLQRTLALGPDEYMFSDDEGFDISEEVILDFVQKAEHAKMRRGVGTSGAENAPASPFDDPSSLERFRRLVRQHVHVGDDPSEPTTLAQVAPLAVGLKIGEVHPDDLMPVARFVDSVAK